MAAVTTRENLGLIRIFLVLFTFRCCCLVTSANDGETTFQQFLNIFAGCDVRLYNYRNVPVFSPGVPLTVYGSGDFTMEEDVQTRSSCLVIFYLAPPSSNSDRDSERDPYNRRDLYSIRGPRMLTSARYDVLLDEDKGGSSDPWIRQYKQLYDSGTPSNGILLTIKETRISSLQAHTKIGDLRIVRKLQLSTGHNAVSSIDINSVLDRGRYELDAVIQEVNSLKANADVSWKLGSVGSSNDLLSSYRNMNGGKKDYNALLELLKSGKYKNYWGDDIWEKMQARGVNIRDLLPHSRSTEVTENYAFAYMALGPNVTLVKDLRHDQHPPTITFGVENGRYVRSTQSRTLGFISCANAPGGRGMQSRRISFFTVVVHYLSVFDLWVYVALIVTFVVPSLVLGLIYHCFLKRRLSEKYWITGRPFTWGLRALIWQSGDRRWHSGRFGFMTGLVGAWGLMAVVISYVFRGSTGRFLGESLYQYNRRPVDLEDLVDAGVTVISDHPKLRDELPRAVVPDRYDQIAKMINGNGTPIAYLSWWDRIELVSRELRDRWGGQGRCRNYTLPHKGKLWWPPSFLRGWQSRMLFSRGGPSHGWEIKRWGDDKLIEKIKMLSGESHIIPEMRRLIAKAGENRGMDGWYGYTFVRSMTMMSRVLYLFLLGGIGLLLGLVIWLLENFWGRLIMRLWGKRKRLRKKTEEEVEIMKEGSSERGSSAGGRDDDVRDLLEESFDTREEAQKGNISTSRETLQVVKVKDTEKIVERNDKEAPVKRNMPMVAVMETGEKQQRQREDSIGVHIDKVEEGSEDSSIGTLELETLDVRSSPDFQDSVSAILELEGHEDDFDLPPERPRRSTPEPAIISTTVSVHVSAEEIEGEKRKN